MINDLIVSRSIMLDADAATVWKLLTDPSMTRQYMYNCEICADWREGSEISWINVNRNKEIQYRGQLLEVIPGRKFRYTTFDVHSGNEDHPDNYIHVDYTLVPKNGRTELQVTLSNFGGDDVRSEHAAASLDFDVLPKLKTMAVDHAVKVGHT